ncbi:cytochrome c oxidase subunit 4 [Phytohabitans rumicis]|uniref:Cytochrome c oxidase polypeptide 4 n=1 Tax=Phytohabitans rumicis TaxID=1076125 RepID=A0A6V8LA13_9ACTN|nr:cytochrome c oxidase subunit 4 [Phytohabitans rumicis]GFJ92450.1 cytochrome c oxidase polypeptide 4 [Phytohabitans rumicis]
MKTEWRIFGIVSVFLYLACVVYAWWTNAEMGEIDWVGTIGLLLSGLLTTMCGGFFWFVSRRIDPRPEDRPDADIVEGAGEIGFFSPGSYWPVGLAGAATVAGLGLVFWMWWLLAVGLIAVTFATCGLLFEYYTGTRRTAEH